MIALMKIDSEIVRAVNFELIKSTREREHGMS